MNDEAGTLIEPTPVTFHWGAPGWYVVGALFLLTLIAAVVIVYRHYQRNRYRRAALNWLSAQESSFHANPTRLAYEATMLVKRIVMARYGRKKSSIVEEEWITFLNSACKVPPFSSDDGQWLTRTLYATNAEVPLTEVQQYVSKTRTWIKRHRYAL